MSEVEAVRFDHLERLSDQRGLFEHAQGTTPRPEHGYCTDDNARMLLVTSRESDHGAPRRLSRLALRFVLDAQASDGRCHNRMNSAGRWTDTVSDQDCWGRSVWGLGAAAVHHGDSSVRRQALRGFDIAVRQRSAHRRSMAFAALGAADVVTLHPDHRGARALLTDALEVIGEPPAGEWRWPEPRLAYANAALAEAVIAAAAALGRPNDLERGLSTLAWLLGQETLHGHLSVVGVGGCGPNEARPQFDQQPIEPAAMADACWRAYTITTDESWLTGIASAAAWFNGDNDTGAVMIDQDSGGSYDGLHADGVNQNQGAESALALISTMQRARSLAPAT